MTMYGLRWMGVVALILCGGGLSAARAAVAQDALLPASHAVQALVDKSDGLVMFFDDQGQEIARFDAVFGNGQGHKMQEGDRRTPEGDYWIKPPRPSQNWGWFMEINYPNRDDVERAKQERRPLDQLGGSVGLHATGPGLMHKAKQFFAQDWTAGCIAVSNDAMDQIRRLVIAPIPIRIQP